MVSPGRGVGGPYTRPEHREAHADEFGGEIDALRPGNAVGWATNSKRTHTQRDPTRVDRVINNSVLADPTSSRKYLCP